MTFFFNMLFSTLALFPLSAGHDDAYANEFVLSTLYSKGAIPIGRLLVPAPEAPPSMLLQKPAKDLYAVLHLFSFPSIFLVYFILFVYHALQLG